MKNQGKTAEAARTKEKDVGTKAKKYPEPDFIDDEIAESKKGKGTTNELINNTGLGPGEYPDLAPGTDADPAGG